MPNIISTTVDIVIFANISNGYMPNIISTTVDSRDVLTMSKRGYMPNIISTTVDTTVTCVLLIGYMPNIISTTVDQHALRLSDPLAICLI